MRPLHASYLKTGSQTEVKPLQASLIIPLCALLGWSILIRSCLWVSICAPKESVFLWFVQFWRGWTSETTAHTLLEIWVTGWSETTTSTPYHITLCFVGGDLSSLDYICGYQYELLKGQFVYGLYSFAWTEQVRPLQASYLKTGSQDEVRPLQASLVISPCALLGDVFSLDHLYGYQYEFLRGQFVYSLYSFGGAEQVRPLHTPYLKSGSQDEVRPLQAPLIISICALLGWSFLIRLNLWVSIWAPKGSMCLWFLQFCLDRTRETIARILLEIWVTDWSETTTSTLSHNTLSIVGMLFSH